MAREILFRAKRIDNGEWVEGSYVKSNAINEYARTGAYILACDDEMKRHLIYIDENTVCQYTGLTDNNGDKIWENDIVNFEEEMYMVDWSEMDACFEIFNTGLIERFTTIRSEDCEIIGNKFDNPELLEVLS